MRCSAARAADVVAGFRQCPLQIDEHVDADECDPDHRRRSVQATRERQRVAVEEAHCDAAAEEHDGREDEPWCEQPHDELRRPLLDVGSAPDVVAREAPAGAPQLQQDERDQDETDEDVQRHERMDAEKDRRQLDEDRREQ